jgi:guanine deaminase
MAVRFAPTSTPELLKGAGELLNRHPGLVLQTHLAETKDEIQWVKELFPSAKNYTQVYAEAGLAGARSLFGHGIYMDDTEIDTVKRNRSHLVHCPSSNFFLGSGLFDYKRASQKGVSVALGSDVGAGWDLSLQSTARCCYEAQALQKYFMKPAELLYLATRAGARALGYESELGLLEKGFKADFVVHDLRGRSLVLGRAERAEKPDELLSALLFLGGESTLAATYTDGRRRFKK